MCRVSVHSSFLVMTQLYLPPCLAFSTKEAGRFHFSRDKTGHFHQVPWKMAAAWLSRIEKVTRGIWPLGVQTSPSVRFQAQPSPPAPHGHSPPGSQPSGVLRGRPCNATSSSVSEQYVLASCTQMPHCASPLKRNKQKTCLLH